MNTNFLAFAAWVALTFGVAVPLCLLSDWLKRRKKKRQQQPIEADPNIRSVSYAPLTAVTRAAPSPIDRPEELSWIDHVIPMRCIACQQVQVVADNLEDIALCDSCGKNSALIQIGPRQNLTIIIYQVSI